MSEFLTKCTVCHGLLDEEDLFCPNCGTEAPCHERTDKISPRVSTYNFSCAGCGASMSYDASARTLRCPFCGSEKLDHEADKKVISPDAVVPFQVVRDEAVQVMRKWLGRGFWRPGDLSRKAIVVAMQAVYVPYWIFDAKTFTYWTADSSKTPFGARGDWHPMSGEHHGEHRGLLVAASSVLTPSETDSIAPFDLDTAVAPEHVDLENVTIEQFGVQRKFARPLAMHGLEDQDRRACEIYVPGRCRNLKVNARVEAMASRPMLLPIWVMAYKYQDQVFRFLVNGQTGKASGRAPTSWKKVALVVAIAATVIVAVVLTIALLRGI